MFPWKYSTVHTADVLPRQFEYHPRYQDVILFGTQDARVGILSTESEQVTPLGVFGKDQFDPILGLCWFRTDDSKFVVGSSHGYLKCGVFSRDEADPTATPITHRYGSFSHLSSVHINSCDTYLLASGTSKDVAIFDLHTGQAVVDIRGIHADSINISRFANQSPHLFATCSFDSTIKLWWVLQKSISLLNFVLDNMLCHHCYHC
jgi:WD40 repeat protein